MGLPPGTEDTVMGWHVYCTWVHAHIVRYVDGAYQKDITVL